MEPAVKNLVYPWEEKQRRICGIPGDFSGAGTAAGICGISMAEEATDQRRLGAWLGRPGRSA